jgi:hypothetical protein
MLMKPKGACGSCSKPADEDSLKVALSMEAPVENRIEELEDTLNAQLASLTWMVMVAMLLSDDKTLLSRVGKGRLPSAISFGPDGPWLLPQERGPPLVQRWRPSGTCVSLKDALATDEELGGLLHTLGRRGGIEAHAEDLLMPVISDCGLPTRQHMEDIQSWAPIFERAAFSANCTLQLLLEATRPYVVHSLCNCTASPVQRILYWGRTRLMGRLSLLCMTPDSDWLRGTDKRYVWDTWTPSKPLLKERSVWMAVIAARAAAAFGRPAISAYQNILQNAANPVDALDAVFGLTAIGYSCTEFRERAMEAIMSSEKSASNIGWFGLTQTARTQALAMLRRPDQWRDKAETRWPSATDLAPALSSRTIMMADPFTATSDGSWEALLAIPIGLSASTPQLFPEQAESDDVISLQDFDALITRAWLADPTERPTTIH